MPIPVNYVFHLLNRVEECGADPNALLATMGIDRKRVEDPQAMIRFEEFRRFILLAIKQCREPALGLLLGNSLSPTAHGVLGLAAMSSACFREAIGVALRYFRVRTPLSSAELVINDEVAICRLHEIYPLGDIRCFYMEAVISALMRISSYLLDLTSTRIELHAVRFPYPAPPHADRYFKVLGVIPEFNSDFAELQFPARLLNVPLALADRQTQQLSLARCEDELAQLEAQQNIKSRIHQRLMMANGQFPEADAIASEMAMTPRTLRRRLAEQGTSFRQVLDEVRCVLALRHLETSTRSVQEIAFHLGYTDPSNFSRAFRKWTGDTPQVWRQKHTRDPDNRNRAVFWSCPMTPELSPT